MGRQKLLRGAAAVAAFVVVLGVLQAAAGFWILSEVQKRAKVKVEGSYWPDFLSPSFKIKNARLVYQDRFEAVSDELTVRYNLVPLSSNLLHVWILGGKDMKVRLLGNWAAVKGVEQEAPLKRFETELQLVKRGILLHAADIQSPVFQFQLKKSDHFKGQLLG